MIPIGDPYDAVDPDQLRPATTGPPGPARVPAAGLRSSRGSRADDGFVPAHIPPGVNPTER